jgi:hypothetical protein
MGEGTVLATDDGKAIKTCRFLNLPFIISPKIATELYRHGCIEGPLAKAAIEKMRIEGRYAPDIMKIAPIYRAALAHSDIDCRIIHTGQHYVRE